MLRTPQIHFDYMRRTVPEGFQLYELVRRTHAKLTDDDLRAGVITEVLNRIDGLSRHMTYAMLLYDRAGQNTYVIGPRVQELFRRTALSKVTRDLVVPPSFGLYVALPSCPLRIWGGERTGMHELRGIYVSFARWVHRDASVKIPSDGIHFVLWGAPNARSTGPGDDAVLWFSLDLDQCFGDGEDLEFFFHQHDVMVADASAATRWEGDDPFALRHEPLIPKDPERLAEQRATLVASLRLVLNLCLYVSSEDPDLEIDDLGQEAERLGREMSRKKAGGKKKKLERRIAQMSRTKYVYVGPQFERREKGAGGGGPHAAPVEHQVRPHWQHYWTGTGDERRRVLVYKGMYVRGSGTPERTVIKFRE